MTRLMSGDRDAHDPPDRALRPQTLAEFVGQPNLKANLKIFIDAAKTRGDSLDHVLLFGPPGLGKTTLAQIVARELGVSFRATAGPVLAKAGDLAAILTNLEPRDVLFIDEIHRLPPAVEEILYPAMEDHVLDLIIGEGPSARSVRIDLAPFTLVAATTRAGLLATPLRDRFGIPLRLDFYSSEDLCKVLAHAARKLGAPLTPEGAAEMRPVYKRSVWKAWSNSVCTRRKSRMGEISEQAASSRQVKQSKECRRMVVGRVGKYGRDFGGLCRRHGALLQQLCHVYACQVDEVECE